MVGFPGENKETFCRLLDFISNAQLDWAGFFVYSRQEGTPAFVMSSQKKEKKARQKNRLRIKEAVRLQEEISVKRLGRFTGNRLTVLIEEKVQEQALFLGRAWFQAPEVDGLVVVKAQANTIKPGELVKCRITRQNGLDLEAVVEAN